MAILLGLIASAVAVILVVIDRGPATTAARDASVAFATTTTLCLLLFSELRDHYSQGPE
ncbi:hypothetical protein [Streptomyces sp. NPDC050439]|uniref:hypothetical protein n=1 Tax=unclassified Streptomyces TaxID=2593676 RepID=UPI003446818F